MEQSGDGREREVKSNDVVGIRERRRMKEREGRKGRGENLRGHGARGLVACAWRYFF